MVQFAHLCKVVQRLVHRAQGDTGHLRLGSGKEDLRRRMGGVPVEQAEDQLALWSDLQTTAAEGSSELGR